MVVVTHDAYNFKDINGVYWVYFFKQGYSLQGIDFEWLNEHHRSHTLCENKLSTNIVYNIMK